MQVNLALEGEDFRRIGQRHLTKMEQELCALTRHPKRPWRGAASLFQMLLPLHFNFWRTTLKNDVSGMTASGSVLSALVMRTTAPVSRRNGSRPSTVR